MSIRRVIPLLLLTVTAACGTANQQVARGDRNLITADEINQTRVSSAYEAVERLRPEFLRARGPFSVSSRNAGLPVIYLDGVPYGNMEQLRNIGANVVQSIEYISAADATTRWGTGHAGGVLFVRTKR